MWRSQSARTARPKPASATACVRACDRLDHEAAFDRARDGRAAAEAGAADLSRQMMDAEVLHQALLLLLCRLGRPMDGVCDDDRGQRPLTATASSLRRTASSYGLESNCRYCQ